MNEEIQYKDVGEKLRERAAEAAKNETDVEEFANLIHQGTLEGARETVQNMRSPEKREQELQRILQAIYDYQNEGAGSSGEYLLKLAVLLDLEPHELLNPEDPEVVFEKLRQRFS
jgi:hypothetical protein